MPLRMFGVWLGHPLRSHATAAQQGTRAVKLSPGAGCRPQASLQHCLMREHCWQARPHARASVRSASSSSCEARPMDSSAVVAPAAAAAAAAEAEEASIPGGSQHSGRPRRHRSSRASMEQSCSGLPAVAAAGQRRTDEERIGTNEARHCNERKAALDACAAMEQRQQAAWQSDRITDAQPVPYSCHATDPGHADTVRT